MSLSSVGDSSITIASVLSPILEQASISPPPESAPRLDLKEGNYGICCCLTNWFPAASICPDLSPRGSEVRACFWGCYYRAAPGLFGLICPELRADWRSRRDAEDAAWSLSNRSRCWSTKVTDSMHQWPLNWLGPQLHLLFNVRFEGAQTTMMWSITAVTLPGPPSSSPRCCTLTVTYISTEELKSNRKSNYPQYPLFKSIPVYKEETEIIDVSIVKLNKSTMNTKTIQEEVLFLKLL